MNTRLTRRARVLLLLAIVFPVTLRAAPPVATPLDPFLAQLAGDWEQVGTLLGKPVHYRGEGRWVLKSGWLCLTLIDTGTPPKYAASVYFGVDARGGDYIAHWLDQFGGAGARVVATGHRDGQKLVLVFPYEEGAFRDTFSLATDGNSGSLLLESQARDASWSTFASYTLTKQPN